MATGALASLHVIALRFAVGSCFLARGDTCVFFGLRRYVIAHSHSPSRGVRPNIHTGLSATSMCTFDLNALWVFWGAVRKRRSRAVRVPDRNDRAPVPAPSSPIPRPTLRQKWSRTRLLQTCAGCRGPRSARKKPHDSPSGSTPRSLHPSDPVRSRVAAAGAGGGRLALRVGASVAAGWRWSGRSCGGRRRCGLGCWRGWGSRCGPRRGRFDARRAIDHRTGSATTTQERRGRAVVAQRR